MAALNLLNIFCVVDTKSLVPTASGVDRFLLPPFYQGESPPMQFTLLTRNPNGGFLRPWTKISPAAYSLRIGLFLTSNGTTLAFQDTFTDDLSTYSKSATLAYDSAAISTALGSSTSIDCTFEIEVKDASGACSKVYQQAVTLYKYFIAPTTATVPATETAASQSWTQANFAKRYRLAGEFDIWITPNGTAVMVTLGDDLQWNFTPLPAPP